MIVIIQFKRTQTSPLLQAFQYDVFHLNQIIDFSFPHLTQYVLFLFIIPKDKIIITRFQSKCNAFAFRKYSSTCYIGHFIRCHSIPESWSGFHPCPCASQAPIPNTGVSPLYHNIFRPQLCFSSLARLSPSCVHTTT